MVLSSLRWKISTLTLGQHLPLRFCLTMWLNYFQGCLLTVHASLERFFSSKMLSLITQLYNFFITKNIWYHSANWGKSSCWPYWGELICPSSWLSTWMLPEPMHALACQCSYHSSLCPTPQQPPAAVSNNCTEAPGQPLSVHRLFRSYSWVGLEALEPRSPCQECAH